MTVIGDAGRDVEGQAEGGVQERHKEHAAADAEQRAERAGDRAGAHNSRGYSEGDVEVGTVPQVL